MIVDRHEWDAKALVNFYAIFPTTSCRHSTLRRRLVLPYKLPAPRDATGRQVRAVASSTSEAPHPDLTLPPYTHCVGRDHGDWVGADVGPPAVDAITDGRIEDDPFLERHTAPDDHGGKSVERVGGRAIVELAG